MPLTFIGAGETVTVRKVGGDTQTRSHLSDMGFVPNVKVTVVQTQGGNMIINVLDSRIAMTKEMASKVIVETCQAV